MSQIIIVQAGETLWEIERRLDSLAGSPLSEAGKEMMNEIAEQLQSLNPTSVHSPEGQAESEAAGLISERNSLKVRTENGLSEIDYGLWQGLKVDEIKRRQPRLQKQWLEAPSGVRPPGGETLSEAQDRVWNTIVALVKKYRNDTIVVVMRPVVLGLLRCRILDLSLDDVWKQVRPEAHWSVIEVDAGADEEAMFNIGDDNG